MNPYKVLGVEEGATQEEIRAAYLALVKKYHPDRYTDNPLKELATEKLKEINEAYEMLTKKGSASSSRQSYSSDNSYTGSGSSYSGPHASDFARARMFINQNNISAAKQVLDSVPTRNAEWYYLYGVIYLRQGWHDKAREYITRAYQQEPNNAEYRSAFQALNRAGNPYSGSSNSSGGFGTNECDICSSLLCANCLCNAFGRGFCC